MLPVSSAISRPLYVSAENLLDAHIQTGRTAANIVSYDAPRVVTVGLAYRR